MHTCKNTHVCVFSTRVYRLIFTKLSANIEQLVGFITIQSNFNGSIKGRCYGNRFAARVGENRHAPSSFIPLAFDNCCEDRNVDYYINTADKNVMNFGPVTPAS